MDRCADWNVRKGHIIARADFSGRTGKKAITHFNSNRSNDVAFLTIGVNQEGQTGGAVRIVFDRRYFGRNAKFVAGEIDYTDLALDTRSAMAHGNPAHGVATGEHGFGHDQAALRAVLGYFFKRIASFMALAICFCFI